MDQIEIVGTVKKMRRGKKYSFLDVGYGEYLVQVVSLTASIPSELTLQSFVRVSGKKHELPKGVYSHQQYEIVDATIDVLKSADGKTIEMCQLEMTSESKLDQRLYYFRDSKFVLILRIQAKLISSFRKYFDSVDMLEIIPPSFTEIGCEGGAEQFKLKYPGKTATDDMDAYLTQSSQFALEYALPGVGDCYCIAPSFRAEHSHTRRHLTEFTHIEAEWGGVMSFSAHLSRLEHMLKSVIDIFLDMAKKELTTFGVYDRIVVIRKSLEDIVILTHEDAIKKCKEFLIYADEEAKAHFGPRDDIPEKQERKLIDTIAKPVFLVKFPKEFKAFYMALDPDDQSKVLGCDVEVPGVGEIIGSGVREPEYDQLLSRLTEAGLKPDEYHDYLTLRKSGYCHTSGMGLGLGRMMCWLLDLPSIRDVVAFPRFPGYLKL